MSRKKKLNLNLLSAKKKKKGTIIMGQSLTNRHMYITILGFDLNHLNGDILFSFFFLHFFAMYMYNIPTYILDIYFFLLMLLKAQ